MVYLIEMRYIHSCIIVPLWYNSQQEESRMSRPKTDVATYKSLMVRIPTDLLESFKALAAEQRRSLNAQLLCLIEDRVHETEEKHDKPVGVRG